MAALPFLLLVYWFSSKMCDYYSAQCEPVKKSKPRYRMKEVSAEEDELFLTNLGDFDEAFRL